MEKVHSHFVLRTGHRIYYLLLAAFEVYSAALLALYTHGRHVFPNEEWPPLPRNKVVEYILPDVRQSIDPRDILHVCRPLAPIPEEIDGETILDVPAKCIGVPRHHPIFNDGDSAPKIDFGLLIEGTMLVGKPDNSRSGDSWRIGLGFASRFGQMCGVQKVWNHKKLKKRCKEYLSEVGRISAYVYSIMQGFQSAAGLDKLGPDVQRDSSFASRLRKALFLPDGVEMGAEVVFVCVMEVHPSCPENKEHTDRFNSKKHGYHKVGCFNATVAGPHGKLYLVQLILVNRNYLDSKGVAEQWEFYDCPETAQDVHFFRHELVAAKPMVGRVTGASRRASTVYTGKEQTFSGAKEAMGPQTFEISHIYHTGGVDEYDSQQKFSVLEDANMPIAFGSCVDVAKLPSFCRLMDKFSSINWLRDEVFGGSYLAGTEDPGQGTLQSFPGHVDKAKFERVLFLPLGGFFWTFLAIPLYDLANANGNVPRDSFEEYSEWVNSLDDRGKGQTKAFMKSFKSMAEKELRYGVEIRIFRSCPGTALLFPPKRWFHGTISVGGQGAKENLILHALIDAE